MLPARNANVRNGHKADVEVVDNFCYCSANHHSCALRIVPRNWRVKLRHGSTRQNFNAIIYATAQPAKTQAGLVGCKRVRRYSHHHD